MPSLVHLLSGLPLSASSMALEIWGTCAFPHIMSRHEILKGYVQSRISSYVWKASWGPDYHQSMVIGIAGLALATALAIGDYCISALQSTKLIMRNCQSSDASSSPRTSGSNAKNWTCKRAHGANASKKPRVWRASLLRKRCSARRGSGT